MPPCGMPSGGLRRRRSPYLSGGCRAGSAPGERGGRGRLAIEKGMTRGGGTAPRGPGPIQAAKRCLSAKRQRPYGWDREAFQAGDALERIWGASEGKRPAKNGYIRPVSADLPCRRRSARCRDCGSRRVWPPPERRTTAGRSARRSRRRATRRPAVPADAWIPDGHRHRRKPGRDVWYGGPVLSCRGLYQPGAGGASGKCPHWPEIFIFLRRKKIFLS